MAASGGSKIVNPGFRVCTYKPCVEKGGDRKTMQQPIMSQGTKRWIFRWIHIVFSIPIIGYIYSPFDQIPNYARPTRYFFVPVMIVSGLWMWKGHVARRLFSKRPAQATE